MFRFKQFSIRQERCPMKVGTDGVLLGAWARVLPGDRRMLDIGTGTGLVALMLAQRTEEVRITGIDIDDVAEARENAAASPWGDRVELLQCPLQEFRPSCRYDLIVSNPPYFVDSLTSPDRGRTTARHAVSLPFEALRDGVARLLADGGRFAVVLPVEEGRLFEQLAREVLFVSRRTRVRTTPHRAPRRVLLEFVRRAPGVEQVAELTVGTGVHEEYTAEYRALTRDFYLKF